MTLAGAKEGLKIDHAKQIRKWWPRRLAPVKNCRRQSAIGSFLTIFVKKKNYQRGAWHITEKMLMHSKWIFMYVAGRGPVPVHCCTSIAD